jgi:PIN domain nuclease of toxin-antitoxin system
MKLLLDTQIFLWFVAGDRRLTPDVLAQTKDKQNQVFISVVSIWEAVIKYAIGKLTLDEPPHLLLPRVRDEHKFGGLNLDEGALPHLAALPMLHRDPFDRILVAQSLQHGLTVVSVDAEVRKYPVPVYPPRPA